ncbi:unnamed protein product [Lathyrus oleraceus]
MPILLFQSLPSCGRCVLAFELCYAIHVFCYDLMQVLPLHGVFLSSCGYCLDLALRLGNNWLPLRYHMVVTCLATDRHMQAGSCNHVYVTLFSWCLGFSCCGPDLVMCENGIKALWKKQA